MKKRKRAITAALCLFLCLLIFFLIWVENAYGRHNIWGRSTFPPQRLIRQLMLPDSEEVYRSKDGLSIYNSEKYMLMFVKETQNYSLCKFENGAAILPGTCGIGVAGGDFAEILIPFYALHRHNEAARAELEIHVSRTSSPYGSGDGHELHCLLPSESCTDTLALFTLRTDNSNSHIASLAEDFWLCLNNGSIINAVYYKMNIRFYDADGALISDSVFEMGEKES